MSRAVTPGLAYRYTGLGADYGRVSQHQSPGDGVRPWLVDHLTNVSSSAQLLPALRARGAAVTPPVGPHPEGWAPDLSGPVMGRYLLPSGPGPGTAISEVYQGCSRHSGLDSQWNWYSYRSFYNRIISGTAPSTTYYMALFTAGICF